MSQRWIWQKKRVFGRNETEIKNTKTHGMQPKQNSMEQVLKLTICMMASLYGREHAVFALLGLTYFTGLQLDSYYTVESH